MLNHEVAEALNGITSFAGRFVVLTEYQLSAIALWVVHTHAFDAAETTPYLAITSADRRSGKTRLLEVLELLVARPWFTGRTSPAALVRYIEAETPTLLLYESDAAFAGERDYAEALRGVLNTGYKRRGRYTLCGNAGATIQHFSTFAPKAIAGIGHLPDTVADRSILIRLETKDSRRARGAIHTPNR